MTKWLMYACILNFQIIISTTLVLLWTTFNVDLCLLSRMKKDYCYKKIICVKKETLKLTMCSDCKNNKTQNKLT